MTPGELAVSPPTERSPSGADGPAYELRYTQTFDAAIDAGRLLGAGTYRWYYLALLAGAAAGALIALSNPTLGIAIAGICLLMIVMTRFAVLDRLFRRRRYQSLLDRPIRLRIADDGILWEGPQGTSHIPWSSITEVRNHARMVLFIGGRRLVTYVPASAFDGPAAQADVVDYARRQIEAAESGGDER